MSDQRKIDDIEPIKSMDGRAGLYFEYVEQGKIRDSESDPTLCSNYAPKRYERKDRYGGNTNILLLEEVILMKAEVAFARGRYQEAQEILNASNRVTVGKLPPLTGANKEEIADALFYETSIELFLAGKGVSWFFMRRWDKLQEGTMLHFPVPAKEIRILGKTSSGKVPVTIGGQGTGDGKDSATGKHAWRKD